MYNSLQIICQKYILNIINYYNNHNKYNKYNKHNKYNKYNNVKYMMKMNYKDLEIKYNNMEQIKNNKKLYNQQKSM